jgi:D-3-phosphoglycerate dehydrogenase
MSSDLPLLWTDVSLHPDALEQLAGHVQLAGTALPDHVARAGDYESAVAAIVSPRFRGDAAAFARAPRLQIIGRTGIGYDNIDIAAASAAGVAAINTPDAPTESTAEFAIAMMFAVARRLATADRNSKAGLWQTDVSVIGFDLAGKTLGLVGFGRIARRVSEMARAIRMRVVAFDPFVSPAAFAGAATPSCATLRELLQQAQVLSLHVPSTAATRRLIGREEVALLPRGAILINTARGSLLDESAVLAALHDGHLDGAGIDVWPEEPAPPDHPLLRHPRVVATPHIAAFTDEGRRRSHVTAAQMVLAGLRGEQPATLINPEVWERRRK